MLTDKEVGALDRISKIVNEYITIEDSEALEIIKNNA
jgi:hypothetical protein